jgi:hypothetical protein
MLQGDITAQAQAAAAPKLQIGVDGIDFVVEIAGEATSA